MERKLTRLVTMRFTEQQYAELQRAAEIAQRRQSDFTRIAVMAEVMRILQQVSK
jgi:uncharacterized protein (DUF1778 family)